MTIKNWVDCRKYLPRLWADIYMFCIYIIEYKANEHIIQYRKIGDRIAILIQIMLFAMMKTLLKNLEFTSFCQTIEHTRQWSSIYYQFRMI